MSETRYIISDAAKMIDVEPHVLRYWEEELGMQIPRNEMGHRYYTEREVKIFSTVRDLKARGLQLKAIKVVLSTLHENPSENNIISLDAMRKNMKVEKEDEQIKNEVVKEENIKLTAEEKVKHFKYMMDSIVMQALHKNNEFLITQLEEKVSERILGEMDDLFRIQEAREDERFRDLDAKIRSRQNGCKDAAAAGISVKAHSKKRLFRKKNN